MSLFNRFQIVHSRWLDFIWPITLTVIPLCIGLNKNFEYEYWLSVSLLASLVTPFFGVLTKQKLFNLSQTSFFFKNLISIPCLILLTSFILLKMTGSACEKKISFVWFVILAYPAWMIAIAMATITRYLAKTKSIRIALVSQTLITALLLIFAVCIFWFMPQKRLTSIILSHIHGPIYDVWIPIDWGIIYARACHLILAIFIAGLFYRSSPLKLSSRFFLGLGVILCLFIGQIQFPSLQHGKYFLEKQLPFKKKQSNFTIHYANFGDNPDYEKNIDLLFHQAKFDISDLSKIFIDMPEHTHIYVYPSLNAKKLWFGGDRTDITDVVTPSIHILAENFPHPTMRHELVHALASKSAYFGLGFHPNMALTEGIAVALAPQARELTLSESVSAMKAQGRLPNLNDLFSPLFWTNSGARSYITAGSFIEYLLQTYGSKAIFDLYSGKSWNESIERSLDEELEIWLKQLESSSIGQNKNLGAERIFRHPGVFKDQCPHSKAVMRRNAKGDFFTALRQPFGWDPIDYWQWRRLLNPDDKTAQFNDVLLNLKQMISSSHQDHLQDINTLKNTLKDHVKLPIKTLEDLDFLLLKNDLEYVFTFEENSYISKLDELIKNPDLTRSLDDGSNRKILARRLIAQSDIESKSKKAWIKYLAGIGSIPKSGPLDQRAWITTYLKTFVEDAFTERTELLTNMPLNKQASPSMLYMWQLNISIRLMQEKQWNLAIDALEKAKQHAKPAQIIYLDLLLKMSRWSLLTD